MSAPEEEKELYAAVIKLQGQIDEQKKLVHKMIEFKRRRIDSETDKLQGLKFLVNQQNREEKKLKKQTLAKATESKVTKPKKAKLKMTKVKKHEPEPVSKQAASKLLMIPDTLCTINYHKTELPFINTFPNKFQRKILANRKNYYYKNRKFFHGYKFVLTSNDQKLCIVSASHELTGEPLNNAIVLPVFITLNGKNYIKSAKGNYYLENLSKKVRDQMSTNTLPTKEYCIFFTKTGHCGNVNCLFQHPPGRVALCPTIQSTKHKCPNKVCHFSHNPNQFNSPSCTFFQDNNCYNDNCIFTHKKETKTAPVCREFAYLGYCQHGMKCKFTHSFECPDVKEYGRCLRGRLCTCLHNLNLINNASKAMDGNNPKGSTVEVRNKDNDRVIQVMYDDVKDYVAKSNIIDSSDDDSDDNVEFIVGPVGQELSRNQDYVRL